MIGKVVAILLSIAVFGVTSIPTVAGDIGAPESLVHHAGVAKAPEPGWLAMVLIGIAVAVLGRLRLNLNQPAKASVNLSLPVGSVGRSGLADSAPPTR